MENENELSFEEERKGRTKAWENWQRESFRCMKHPRLRILVEAYYDLQKLRISEGSRVQMYDRFDMLNPLQSAKLQAMVKELEQDEQEIAKFQDDELKGIPIWLSWLRHIKGVGPTMGAGLVAWIGGVWKYKCSTCGYTWKPLRPTPGKKFSVPKKCPNCDAKFPEFPPHISGIECFDTVSKLWQYSGFGKPGQKRVHGEKGNWNPRMRTHMWKVIKQMLMAKNQFYRGHYDEAKMKYLMREDIKEMHKGKKGYKGHVDAMAKRKVAKLFLAHLWEMWRRAEGLEIRTPYVVEKYGHHIIPPPKFDGGE